MNVCVCSCMHPRSCIWRLEEDVRSPALSPSAFSLERGSPQFLTRLVASKPQWPLCFYIYSPSTALTGSHTMSCSVHRCWGSKLRTSGFPASGLPCWAVSMSLLALPLVFVLVILLYFCRNLCRISCSFLCRLWWVIRVIILSPLVAVSLPGLSFRDIVTLMIL